MGCGYTVGFLLRVFSLIFDFGNTWVCLFVRYHDPWRPVYRLTSPTEYSDKLKPIVSSGGTIHREYICSYRGTVYRVIDDYNRLVRHTMLRITWALNVPASTKWGSP